MSMLSVRLVAYALLFFSPALSFRAARIDFVEGPSDDHVHVNSSNIDTSTLYSQSVFMEDVVIYMPIVFVGACALSYVGHTRAGYILTSLCCLGALYASIIGRMQVVFMLGCGILLVFSFQLVELLIELAQDDHTESIPSRPFRKRSAGTELSEHNFLRLFQGSSDSFFKFYQIAHVLPDLTTLKKDINNDISLALPGSRSKAVLLHVPTVADVTRSSTRKHITVDDLELWLHTQGVGTPWKFWLQTETRTTRLAMNILSFASASRMAAGSGNNITPSLTSDLQSLTDDEWNRVAPYVALFLHLDDDKDGLLTFKQAQPFLAGLLLPAKAFDTPTPKDGEPQAVSS